MPRNSAAYDVDFYAWSHEQATLLRSGQFSQVDIENVAEELESMGRSARRELKNRLSVLVMHLLRWQYQPGFQSRSWSGSIRVQRAQVEELLDESPSLNPLITQDLAYVYAVASVKAQAATGLPEASFPVNCPFTPEQILSEDFLPEN